MHGAAHDWVAKQVAAHGPFVSVLEVGSRNVNGSIRDLFDGSVFEGVDVAAGDGVDYVCDATMRLPAGPYDCVVCCEVFEHCARWPDIVVNVAGVLMSGGVLIVTAAGPGRPTHSAVDGGALRAGEHYQNVAPAELVVAHVTAGLSGVVVDVDGHDVRSIAVKG